MPLASQLDRTLRAAGLPVIGVSLGTETDKATWRVDLAKDATKAQYTQAAGIVANFAPVDEEVFAVTIDAVLAWCAVKLGIDPMDAMLEILSGMKK